MIIDDIIERKDKIYCKNCGKSKKECVKFGQCETSEISYRKLLERKKDIMNIQDDLVLLIYIRVILHYIMQLYVKIKQQ